MKTTDHDTLETLVQQIYDYTSDNIQKHIVENVVITT